VAVFQNRFPSLELMPKQPAPLFATPTAPAFGACEVVVFSQDPAASLAQLEANHVALLLRVFAARTRSMAAAGVKYVLPFENRGVEMGVTLSHPHGQVYGYGFVPAIQQRAMESMKSHLEATGTTLIRTSTEAARRLGLVVTERPHAVAFVPPFARFPYECWITTATSAAYLDELPARDLADLARVLSESVRRLDALFDSPMPYLLTVNQAPTDGAAHAEWSTYIAIAPIRRAAGKLKYLAGTELGAGVFASDILPEQAAAALRGVAL
jgi:UDPglucose--hexose-1-phosphate uridylyltransferase